MAPIYQPFTKAVPPLVFYDTSTSLEISKSRSWPTPMQGESFANCPLMAALASIAWVNRKFIQTGIISPKADTSTGKYTFTFWSYKKTLANQTIASVSMNTAATSDITAASAVSLGGQLNATDTKTAVNGIKTNITVPNEALLDANYRFADPNGTFYGAGSSIAKEAWPAVLERAYAKFCFFENNLTPSGGALQCTTSNDAQGNMVNTVTGPDPTYDDLKSLSMTQWGGNAGIALMYLTGVNCFQCSTTNQATPVGSSIVGADTTSLYNFITSAFCAEAGNDRRPNGVSKTRYPLVAVTYPEGCQLNKVIFNQDSTKGIVSNHCYAILGTYAIPNGHNYIVLRTTFGLKDPSNLTGTIPGGSDPWLYNDARFQIGKIAQFPPDNSTQINQNLDLSLNDAIFGLEASAFANYFQMIAWAEGYI